MICYTWTRMERWWGWSSTYDILYYSFNDRHRRRSFYRTDSIRISLAMLAANKRNPEYEDPDDEWPWDLRREICPLNDVTFLIQRARGSDRNGLLSLSLSQTFSFFLISVLDLSFYLSPLYTYISVVSIGETDLWAVGAIWTISWLAVLKKEKDKEKERVCSKSNLAAVSVTLHPVRTNNVQLDTLQAAPTSGFLLMVPRLHL